MSDEQEDKIEKTFIDGLGATYPMAKIKPSATADYKVKFYPSFYCLAPDGTVHSTPDDRMPSEESIEKLLEDVSLAPKLPDDARYAPVRKMWEKRDYSKLDSYLQRMLGADKLDADMREVFEGQQEVLAKKASKQLARVQSLGAGPDFLASRAALERIKKDWRGFDAAKQATAELKRFSKDSQIKKEIAASKALAKLEGKYDPSRIAQARKLQDALRKFADRYEGTYAGEQAKKKLGR
ncbi:MAG: hypothetical protein CMJ88_05915 [Planctomycetes bacterium]|nr:hypothetical protein [Planctomycetota bacterium]